MLGSRPTNLSKKLYKLTIGGGMAFWATSIATSLLPMAAGYRASFANKSWSIQAVWVGALIGGLTIGFCVSYLLLRFSDRIPTGNPILKSVMISFVALVVATILIDVPKLLAGPSNASYGFLIGIVLNIPRFLFLGMVIGYLYRKQYSPARAQG